MIEQLRSNEVKQLSVDKGVGAIDELAELLIDPSWLVRRAVVGALAAIGEEAIKPLCNLLVNKRDNEARIAATVDALVMISVPVEAEVSKLAMHPDPAIVADVAQILGRRRNHLSVPILVELTKHVDDNVAVGAVEALGRIGGRAAVEAMIESINTGNFFRVFPAIDVLGRSGDPRSIEPLANLLKNPNYRPEATRALGRTGERSAVKPLVELLKSSSDVVVRLTAASLIELRERFTEKSGDSGLAIDELILTLSDSETVRRVTRAFAKADTAEAIALCKVLGTIGSAEASPFLTAALDGDATVATAAAEALKKIGKDADEHLIAALREGSSDRRKALLPVIMQSSAAAAVAFCLQDQESEVRALACDTLARLGNSSVVAEIFPLLSDANPRVVLAAVAAIQALGNRSARELAVQASSSAQAGVRRSALRILTYFGDESALEPMLHGLQDTDARVREAALQGLPYLESATALNALIDASKSSDDRTRALAMRSLGQVPKDSGRVISLLLKGLADQDSWVRYYACQSLGRSGYIPAASEIVKLLADSAGQVRVSAVEALSHLDSPDAHTALRQAAASDELEIKRAALVGLGLSRHADDLPVVLASVRSDDISTRLMALSALASFTSTDVVPTLSDAALDSDEQVSSAAINFLAARVEPKATEALVTLLAGDRTRERSRTALATQAVGRISGLLTSLEMASDEIAALLIGILSRIERPEAKKALIATMQLPNVAARKAAATALAARREPEMLVALQAAADNDADEEVRLICSLLLHD